MSDISDQEIKKLFGFFVKALQKRNVDEIKKLVEPAKSFSRSRAQSGKSKRPEIRLQASLPDVKKLDQILLCEELVKGAATIYDTALKQRADLLMAKVSGDKEIIKDLINYGFSKFGLSIISHGKNKKINRFFGKKSHYKYTSSTNLGTLPALITSAKELGYGYLSVTGCEIGKEMKDNDVCEASKKNSDFCCIINSGSKKVIATNEILEKEDIAIDLTKYLPPEIIEGTSKSNIEAISIFLSQMINSIETGYFLYNGKYFKKNSNYYKKDVSVEHHITESVKNFLKFLYDNKVINTTLDKDSYYKLSEEAADKGVKDILVTYPNFAKEYNADLLVNKFYRKGKIESEFFEDKGYKVSDFIDFVKQPIISIDQSASDSLRAIKLFVENGLDVNMRLSYFGIPLINYCVAQYNKIKTVKFLIENGADVNSANASDGYTSLHICANLTKGGYGLELAKMLINSGANIRAKNVDGCEPLHLACMNENGNLSLIKFLISKGADIKCVNNIGITPLHSCVNKEVAKFLIEKGLDVNARDVEGRTPIHCLSNLIQYLGRVPDSKDKKNTFKNIVEVMKALLEKGADINAKNKYGETPLHILASAIEENPNLEKRKDILKLMQYFIKMVLISMLKTKKVERHYKIVVTRKYVNLLKRMVERLAE